MGHSIWLGAERRSGVLLVSRRFVPLWPTTSACLANLGVRIVSLRVGIQGAPNLAVATIITTAVDPTGTRTERFSIVL